MNEEGLIPKEKIEKLKAETEQQLNYARQQAAFWSKKVEQLTGSLAVCNVILKNHIGAEAVEVEEKKRMKLCFFGYRREPPDTRDLLVTMPQYDLPKEVDWTEQVTGIKDQGQEGICVGQAVAAMSEYKEWREHGKKFDFSERWIYEWAKEHDEWPGSDYDGTSIRGAMKALAQHGICEEEYWRYVPGKRGKPDEKAAENAYQHRIQKYRSLTIPKKDIGLIKRGLHESGPVVLAFAVHASWFNVGKDGIIKKPGPKDQILGYHAILAVAYDNEYLKIKNSWSTNWGAGGFGYLAFDYAMDILHAGWAAFDL